MNNEPLRATKVGASLIVNRNGHEETIAHLTQRADPAERLADAQRIVRAWNCFDDLIAACELAKDSLDVIRYMADEGSQIDEALKAVKAAIAKAKGESQ